MLPADAVLCSFGRVRVGAADMMCARCVNEMKKGNGVHDDTMERVRRLLSGREVRASSGGAEVVCVKAAVAALPRGTKRGAPG